MIDIAFKNNIKPTNGCVLISDPFLDEDFFRRSVILLCDHSSEGSFGFVLNNFLDIDLHEIDNDFPDINAVISVGGPVETESLFYIHTFGDIIKDSTPVNDSISIGGNFEQIKEELSKDQENHSKIRFFLGYSGWDKLQLSREMSENSWIVASNITTDELLSIHQKDFWQYCIEKQGERFKTIAKFPINPIDN
jgi:putative transcriptional regulator